MSNPYRVVQQTNAQVDGKCPACGKRRKASAAGVTINAIFSLARILGEVWAGLLVDPMPLRIILFSLAGLELLSLAVLGHKKASEG